MDLSPAVYVVVFAVTGVSVYFYFLAKGMPLARRIAVSAHGILSLAIYPLAVFVHEVPGIAGPDAWQVAAAAACLVVLASIGYSVFALRVKWYEHLLHLLTLYLMGVQLVLAALVLGGH